MNYAKIIGLGLVEWALMFALVSSVLEWYQSSDAVKFMLAIAAGVIAYFLAATLTIRGHRDAIMVGLFWVVVGLALDALVTLRFDPDIFSSWSLWLGYLAVAYAPMLRCHTQST